MKTKLYSREALKSIVGEIFLNKTDKVTKITNESILNAMFFSDSRLAQLVLKEVALTESKIFPQYASGSQLDEAGLLFDSIERYGASSSTTSLRIVADPGTVYPQIGTVFTGANSINFELIDDFTIDDNGYGYAKVRSIETGSRANVDPVTITSVSPEPSGHIAVANEFMATGGRDEESDEDFRARIKSHKNLQARDTLAYLIEVFRLFNEDVLTIQNLGIGSDGKLQLSIVLQNGSQLTENELNSLLDSAKSYFSLTDLNKQGDVIGITLINSEWYSVGGSTGVDFRVQLFQNYNPDTIRKNIQTAMSKYLDVRSWTVNRVVEWDELLRIVKDVEGVKYVPDEFFHPNVDEEVPTNQYPRIEKFIMRDLNGVILSDNNGVLSPIFYPNN